MTHIEFPVRRRRIELEVEGDFTDEEWATLCGEIEETVNGVVLEMTVVHLRYRFVHDVFEQEKADGRRTE